MKPIFHWRAMEAADLAAVQTVAAVVHRDFPEDRAVFAERLQLYPEGAFILEGGGMVGGYAIAHPWTLGSAPALNSRIGTLPQYSDSFYIHDVALLPSARGSGAARAIVTLLSDRARASGFATLSLIAVGGSQSFWAHCGFHDASNLLPVEKRASYGETARYMVQDLRDG